MFPICPVRHNGMAVVQFEKKKLTIICQKQNSRTNIGSIQIVTHLKLFCLTYHLLKSYEI
jgi:hypothetical protein